MPQYLTYTKFYTPEDLTMLTSLLDASNIHYTVEHDINQLDKVYIGESLDPMFLVKLPKNEFSKVTNLLRDQADADNMNPDFSYYLYSYEVSELREILCQPNDWNAYDLRMAELLLAQKTNSPLVLHSDYSNSYHPESIQMQWIVLGYLLCFLTIAGVLIGLSITQAKRTLKNGETVNVYDDITNRHGKRMILLGTITTVLFIWRRFFV